MNKFLKEYLDAENNQEKNFEQIKLKILKQKQKTRKILSTVAVLLVVIIVGSLSPQMYAKFQLDQKYKEYIRRDYVSGKGKIATAYSENVDMDYVFQDDVGVKIASLILTDDALKIGVDVKLPEKYRIDKMPEYNNENTHIFYVAGYAIYDENNTIYDINPIFNPEPKKMEERANYIKLLNKELGKGYLGNDIYSSHLSCSAGCNLKESDDEKLSLEIKNESLEGFPNSEKLFIRILGIGAQVIKTDTNNLPEVFEFSNSEWIFEIEAPDKFIKRETWNLELLDEIPGLKIEKFTISETGTVLKARKKAVIKTIGAGKDMESSQWTKVHDALINITDKEGNIYYPIQGGTAEGKNGFYSMFEIDKDILETTTLYLNMETLDDKYSSELKVVK